MKTICFPLFLLALTWTALGGDDVAHFTRVEVPANEERLTQLARLMEWRCNYELEPRASEFVLIAEYYKDGVCIGDYLLCSDYAGDVKKGDGKKLAGTISVAWHVDFHNLVSATQDIRFPRAAVHLADFRAFDGHFFKDSRPEVRQPSGKNAPGGVAFELYPVLGISGERQLQLGRFASQGAKGFLDACKLAGAKDAIVVYLYFSVNGEEPCMDFKESPPPDAPCGN